MRVRRVLVGVAVLGGCLAASNGAVSTIPGAGAVTGRAAPSVDCGSLKLSSAASGAPVQTSAVLGGLKAELSGTATTTYGLAGVAGPTIRVFDHGRQVLSTRVALYQEAPGSPLVPGDIERAAAPAPWSFLSPFSEQPLCIARFGGPRGDTAVLIAVYSGGAHCCTSLDAYVVSAGRVPAKPLQRELADAGASLVTLGGHAVIATEDSAFAYEFASFGFSGLPLLTLEIRGGRFVTTTGAYPAWVGVDAGFQWGRFIQQTNMGLGWLAAWAADECTLGQSAQVSATLTELESQGFLGGQPSGWPEGSAYVSSLRKFLAARGYCAT
jgi:hypothetical protein